jgi:hypothetical protein
MLDSVARNQSETDIDFNDFRVQSYVALNFEQCLKLRKYCTQLCVEIYTIALSTHRHAGGMHFMAISQLSQEIFSMECYCS